jgi:hypothetical protein
MPVHPHSKFNSIIRRDIDLTGSFSIISEMRDQRLGFRVVYVGHLIVTAVYIAIGTVVYWYCGIYVATPALGSAGALMKRISYGLALPGLFVTICIYLHVSRSSSARTLADPIASRKIHFPAIDEGKSTFDQ